MTDEYKLELLYFIKSKVGEKKEQKHYSLYTCHIMGERFDLNSAEFLWWQNVITNLASEHPDIVGELKLGARTSFEIKSKSPFSSNEFDDRMTMLNGLIEKLTKISND